MLRVLSAIFLFHCANSQSVPFNRCTLPVYPEHGTYAFISPGSKRLGPGDEVVQFTILRYSCDAGYEISDVVNVCGETRTWSREPYCKQLNTNGVAEESSSLPDLTSCILPPLPENGNYSFVGDFVTTKSPGDRVAQHTILRYSCQPGYVINKSVFISTCLAASWTETLTCKTDGGTTGQGTGNAQQNGCVLPQYPNNGNYIVNGIQILSPGTVVDQFTYISFSCNKGYDISGSRLSECNEMNQWSPLPSCHKKCHSPISYSVDFVCRSAFNEVIDCADYVPHGTVIHSTCKQEFNQVLTLHHITCQDGGWSEYPPSCSATCGLEQAEGIELIANGNIATNQAFPWHVGVYYAQPDGRFEHICGGTILYSNVIVGAAHCFYHDNEQIDARYFRIAAGKFYRSYYNEVDNAKHWVQKREVDTIYIPKEYRGRDSQHQSDIALVHLSLPLRFSGSVRPICFDFNDPGLNAYQLMPNTVGKVAGWGLTESDGPSEELRVLHMPIIDINKCAEEVAKYRFLGFLTSDKKCAGYTTGSAVCQGDSGGGLVFSEKRRGQDIWHLRALVSVAPVQTNLETNHTTCRFDTYSAFTEVFKHKDWMIDILKNLTLLTPRYN